MLAWSVVGLGIGASDAIKEHDQEISDCLRKKGYELVADVTISQAIEEIANDVGRAVKGGFEVTAEAITESVEYTSEQLEALHKFLGDGGFYELFGWPGPEGGVD